MGTNNGRVMQMFISRMCKRMESNYSKASAHSSSAFRITKCTKQNFVSHDIIASSEMLSIKITSESIKEETWYAMYDEMINKNFKRGLILKLYMLGKLITTTMHVLLPLARSKLPIFVKIKSPLVMSV